MVLLMVDAFPGAPVYASLFDAEGTFPQFSRSMSAPVIGGSRHGSGDGTARASGRILHVERPGAVGVLSLRGPGVGSTRVITRRASWSGDPSEGANSKSGSIGGS